MTSVISNRVRAPIAMPPRLQFPIFAESPDVAAVLARFNAYADEARAATAKNKAEMEAVNKEIEKLCNKVAGLTINGIRGEGPGSPDPMMPVVRDFMRRGESRDLRQFAVQASMSVGSDPDGGYLALPSVEQGVRDLAQETGAIRSLASVRTIGTNSYKVLANPTLPGAIWVGEAQARQQTSNPQLIEIVVPVNEIEAMPAATQSILDDASIDLGQWLSSNMATAFARTENDAFVAGDGILKPTGILTSKLDTGKDFARPKYNYLQVVPTLSTTPSSSQLAAALVSLSNGLRAPYRANASWVFNRATATALRQIVDSTGRLLWASDPGRLTDPASDLLLGFKFAIDESVPDIASNSTPIMFGDFRQGYMVVDRIGIRVVRDPYTSKPYVLFYTTKRVGGAVIDYNAIKVLRYSAS
jgi:HK97 family phage major capsid protein